MLIRNPKLANLTTALGNGELVQFDESGIGDIADANMFRTLLNEIPAFTSAEDNPDEDNDGIPDFTTMSRKQLERYARENDIDIKGLNRNPEIIAAISKAVAEKGGQPEINTEVPNEEHTEDTQA